MKNKNLNSKIDALSNRINSTKSKAENAKFLKESGIFQSLETDLEATLVLQKDVQTLKYLLKTKSQELEEAVKKLKKGSKDAGKILKKDKKPEKQSREENIQQEKSPAIRKLQGSKKKKAKSKMNAVKHLS